MLDVGLKTMFGVVIPILLIDLMWDSREKNERNRVARNMKI